MTLRHAVEERGLPIGIKMVDAATVLDEKLSKLKTSVPAGIEEGRLIELVHVGSFRAHL